MPLTFTPLPKIPLIHPGDDLADILLTSLQAARISPEDGDILVLAQKIVSKAENRLVNLTTVTPSKEALELAVRSEKDPRLVELILRESRSVLRVRPGASTSLRPSLPWTDTLALAAPGLPCAPASLPSRAHEALRTRVSRPRGRQLQNRRIIHSRGLRPASILPSVNAPYR